jgi:hypothetical protein
MPYLQDFSDFMDDLYNSFNDYHDVLNKLYRYDDKIYDAIENLQGQVNNAGNDIFESAITYIQEEGRRIFVEEIRVALESATEYDYPAFRNRLFNIVQDERLITVRQTDYGGQVNFNMNTVAGTLDDYIEGINFAREQLREESPGKPMPEPAASKVWAEKIYGVNRENKKVTRLKKQPGKKRRKRVDVSEKYRGLYQKTIELRLSQLASQAPFWPIIEFGTDYMVGKGGEAYPEFEGTRFVEKSRIKSQTAFDDYYNTTLSNYVESLNAEIRRLQHWRNEISDEIRSVNRAIENLERQQASRGTLRRVDIATELLNQYLQEERGVIEDLQVIRESAAVGRILAGDPTRSYVGGTRVRLIELTREFQDRINNYIYEGYDIE